jgi:hypothetical protein
MSARANTWVTTNLVGTKPYLMSVLLTLADLADDTGVVTASVDEIADKAQISPKSIKRAFVVLLGSKVISRRRRYVDGVHVPDMTILAPLDPPASRRPMRILPMALREVDNA